MGGVFHITVCSHPDYEELIAEIYVGEEFVGLLSQEKGPEATIFEIHPARLPFEVELPVFEAALAKAKAELWRLRKGP